MKFASKTARNIVIVFCCIILTIVIFFSVVMIYGVTNNNVVSELENRYKKSQSTEDLCMLTDALIGKDEYKRIIKYFPEFVKNVPSITDYVTNADRWKDYIIYFSPIDIQNYYFLSYINAVYEVQGKNAAYQQVEIYSNLLQLECNNNRILSLDIAEIFFL